MGSLIHDESIRSAPPGRMTLSLPLTQGCAALALGYYRWLPTGAEQCATQVLADVEGHLELLFGMQNSLPKYANCTTVEFHSSLEEAAKARA